MSTLAQYTNPALIVPQLRSRDATAATAELCSVLQRHDRVHDLLPFYNAVISHELLSSTATSPGWALPHARQWGLPQLCFALGRAAEPLAWFGQSSQPARLIFLFAVPESESAAYLALVSALARLSQNRRIADQLLDAPDANALLEILQRATVAAPSRRTSSQEHAAGNPAALATTTAPISKT